MYKHIPVLIYKPNLILIYKYNPVLIYKPNLILIYKHTPVLVYKPNLILSSYVNTVLSLYVITALSTYAPCALGLKGLMSGNVPNSFTLFAAGSLPAEENKDLWGIRPAKARQRRPLTHTSCSHSPGEGTHWHSITSATFKWKPHFRESWDALPVWSVTHFEWQLPQFV